MTIVFNSLDIHDYYYYIPIGPIPARFTQLGTNCGTDCCWLLHLTWALISSLCDSDTWWREEKMQPCLKTHYIIVTVALSPGKCLRPCLYSVAAEHSVASSALKRRLQLSPGSFINLAQLTGVFMNRNRGFWLTFVNTSWSQIGLTELFGIFDSK